MLAAWAALPACDDEQRRLLTATIADALQVDHGCDAAERLHTLLAAGQTREALTATLWARDRFPPLRRRAVLVCQRARVREVCAQIERAGATRLWLWGAGQHTGTLLQHPGDLRIPLAGLADDAAAGQTRHALAVVHPTQIPPGEHLLISSDAHEDQMWDAGAPLRARGVHIWRLYGEP
jgi:hypothetical protein